MRRGKLKEFLVAKITRRRLDAFVAENRTSQLALDVGCGPAPYAVHFPNRIGIDIEQRGGAHILGDVQHLPVCSNSVPVAFASELLEHVPDPQRAIDELHRVLVPGGRVILSTRFCFPIHDAPGDYFRFTRFGLEYLFREWTNVHVVAETTLGETFGALLQRVVFQSEVRGGRVTGAVLLVLARTARVLDLFFRRVFGDVTRARETSEILTTGYHVTAQT